jgi:hypothetical protein
MVVGISWEQLLYDEYMHEKSKELNTFYETCKFTLKMLNKDGNVYATKPDTQTKLYMDL